MEKLTTAFFCGVLVASIPLKMAVRSAVSTCSLSVVTVKSGQHGDGTVIWFALL